MRGEDVRGECAGEVRGLARLPSIFFLVLPPLPRAAIKVYMEVAESPHLRGARTCLGPALAGGPGLALQSSISR